MNFKGWEKVEDDGKTAKLRHEKGHEMVIAIKSLPRLQQEAIKRLKLAKGGMLEDESQQGKDVRWAKHERDVHKDEGSAKMHEKFAKDEAKGRAETERHVKPNLKGLADGGEVRKEKGFWDSEHGKQALAAQNKEVENIRQRGDNVKAGKPNPKVKYYADGSPDEVQGADDSSKDQNDSSSTAAPAGANITINTAPAPMAAVPAAQPPSPMQQPNPAVAAAQAQPKVDIPEAPKEQPNTDPRTGQPNPQAILNNSQTSIQGAQDVDTAKDKALAENEENFLKGTARNAEIQQQLGAQYEKHINDAASAIANGAINPKHYQENMGTGQKVTTALGLFLGGLSTPFGGHNFAQDFLDKQIDRDIQAQRDRSDQQKTILGAYEQLYGKGIAAVNATKATLLDARDAQAHKIALQLGTPAAAAKYMQLRTDDAIKKQQLIRDGAANVSMIPGTKNAGSTSSPGAGLVNIPLAAGKKSDKDNHPLSKTILAPDADARMKNIQYDLKSKGLSEDYRPLMTEYTQAKNADASLANINKAYMDLMKINEEGGPKLRAATGGVHSLAGLAGVAGGLFGHGAEAAGATEAALSGISTDLMRRHAAAKSNLLTALSSATKGSNLGSGDLNALVEKNYPVYGNEKKTDAENLLNLRKAVIDHTNRGYLIKHGLSKE